ncbi:MAG: Bax inhibitor-1/YccA family protein [Proteobacteria bacterium]|nr:Bax inhibitor-1/YccA family protein [Pseudomonadota bacterium]HQR04435.1 Bax inhibitor-1/YccA family protein [Rhodocyclaceae bacterium]
MDYNQTVSSLPSATADPQHRVLRNTYALLALSMIPTVIGALLGTTLGVSLMVGSPVMSMLIFFGVTFGLMYGIQRTKDSGMGVVLLLAFTFFMGLMLGPLLHYALGFSNGGSLIAVAAGGTGVMFVTLASIATTSKRDFSKLGGFLFAGLILLVVAGIANMFLHLPALSLALSVGAIFIFSAMILFDIQRIVQGGETNYITATLSVYLDVYNIFVNLLQLLLAFSGDRD